MKGQVLTDFVAEFSPRKEMEVVCHVKVHLWKVFMDNMSNAMRAEVGVVIITSEGIRFFRLGFRASNNEAEYKALLAGLRVCFGSGCLRS